MTIIPLPAGPLARLGCFNDRLYTAADIDSAPAVETGSQVVTAIKQSFTTSPLEPEEHVQAIPPPWVRRSFWARCIKTSRDTGEFAAATGTMLRQGWAWLSIQERLFTGN
jgi:hypothetical protein